MMRFSICLFLLVLLGQAGAAHVTDRLVVGMYAEPSSEGSPLKLLSTGTPLEVLQRRSGFVEVQLADGQKGWVEASYVSEEKPAKAMLLETQARLRHMGLQLATLRAECPTADEADVLPMEASDSVSGGGDARLRQSLDEARARVAQLERQLAERPPEGDARQRLDQLQDRVRQALQLLAEVQPEAPAQAQPQPQPQPQPESGFELFMRYRFWIVGVSAALLGFVAGAAFFDYRFRKRHGGFRI